MMCSSAEVTQALDDLSAVFCRVPVLEKEYVLFGSVVLFLHGLRQDVGDIDVFVTRAAWGRAFAKVNEAAMLTPRAGDPPLIEIVMTRPIHLFYEWTRRDIEWIDERECFEAPERVSGWRCVSMELMRKHKIGADKLYPESREKHLRDLAAMDAAS